MEENSAPKFVLPSPNFNKSHKDVIKTTLHYLTPCGMTLLPRGKQPPPMYGVRGSTVPAKYLKEGTQTPQMLADTPPLYISPPRPEYCRNCGMELATSQDMKRHLQQHEPCPAEDCDFSALAGILERHMEANHITGLYKKVKKVWTPEDIAAWRAERRKRFPTAANVELAKRAKEQRLKRGERLEASRARFGKPEDRRRTRPQSKAAKHQKKRKGHNHQNGQRPKQARLEEKQPEKEEEQNSYAKLTKFRGTAHLLGYKHFKDKAKTEQTSVLSNLLGMYGSDSEEEDDDEEGEEIVTEVDNQQQDTKAESFSTQLKDKQTDSVGSDDAPLDKPIECLTNEQSCSNESELDSKSFPANEIGPTAVAVVSSDDDGPDEAPIVRLTEQHSASEETKNSLLDQNKLPSVTKPLTKNIAPQPKKRHYGLNFKRAKQLTIQTTLLSKLLASDIRHERNILLQCVRFVCEKKFFGIGAKPQEEV